GSTSGIEADRIRLGDLNGDGRLDAVVTETNLGINGNALYWFAQPSNPSSANWPRSTVVSNQGSLNSMDVADLNGDGALDIVTGEHRGSLKVTVLENVGDASSWLSHGISQGTESHLGTQTLDLDGDGDLDVVSIARDNF
ncbi:MAG: VCBS repeat-containing protein, partial [Polyangiales bacterium]